jgi:hypothetical protein
MSRRKHVIINEELPARDDRDFRKEWLFLKNPIFSNG